MSNFEKEISELKNALNFKVNSSENELRNNFIMQFAADEEELGGEVSERPMDNSSDKDEINEILSSPDESEVEVVEWDNFSIAKSDDYANKLTQEQGLDIDDANEKSYFIRYKTPEELLAIQGRIFGINRGEGEGIKSIGGFGTQEKIGKDLEYIKNIWKTGFPLSEKENLLVTLDELSPALQAFKEKSNEKNILNPKEKEIVEVEKEEIEEQPKEEISEEIEKPTINERKKPTPAIPSPLGKVPAYLLNIKLKRESRIKELKNIKG